MGIIQHSKTPIKYLPGRSSADSAFIDRMTATSQQPIAQGTGRNPSTLNAGDSIMGGTFISYNPTQGMRVRFNGREITIPNNLDERAYEHFRADGTLDLVGLIASGANRWNDAYRAFGITGKEFQDASREAQAIRSGKADSLKPFVKDGKLDIVEAVNAGITNYRDYIGFDVSEKDIKEAQEVLKTREMIASVDKYKMKDGNYDLVSAIRDGVNSDTLKTVFDLSDKDLHSFELAASYTTAKANGKTSVDVEKMLKDINSASGKEADILAKELKDLFDLPFIKQGNQWKVHQPTKSDPSRGYPEGIGKSDVDALQNQHNELNNQWQALWSANKDASGRVNDPEIKAQLDSISDQSNAIVSAIKTLNAYDRQHEGKEFANMPTAEDLKLLTSLPSDNGESFISNAINAGISDSALMSVGYSQEGITQVRAFNDAIGVLAKHDAYDKDAKTFDLQQAVAKLDKLSSESDKLSVAQFDQLSKAIDALGFTAEQIGSAREYNAFMNYAEANLPELWEIKLKQGDDAFFKAFEDSQKTLEKYVDKDGNLDVAAAIKAGHTDAKDFAEWGLKQSDIDTYQQTMKSMAVLAPYKDDLYSAFIDGRIEDIRNAYGEEWVAYVESLDKLYKDQGIKPTTVKLKGDDGEFRTLGTVGEFDLVKYLEDNKISAEAIKDSKTAGYSDADINKTIAFINANNKLKEYTDTDNLPQAIRDGSATEQTLREAGYSDKDIKIIVDTAQKYQTPSLQDYTKLKLAQYRSEDPKVDMFTKVDKKTGELLGNGYDPHEFPYTLGMYIG